jgi:polysaccharide biosynthesis/export protein
MRLALSKLAFICCFALAFQLWAVPQAGNQFPPLTGQQQQSESQQSTGSSSLGGTFPNVLNHPNPTITNVSPAQEADDQRRELQAQKTKQEKAEQRTSAPEPDTDFQEFVSSSLGTKLVIFGHNLFDNVPSTFAPLDRVEVTPDYLIGSGDELMIRAWGQINVDVRAVVDRAGTIYIPRVGVFNVAGLRYDGLHDYLAAEMSRLFKNFQLSVTMGRLRSIQVYVVGQVARPGSYTISSLSSLVDALFASGGPSKRGSLRRIQVKRNTQEVTTFDLYDLMVYGDKSKDVKLMPGDVIYVPPVGPMIALAGSVNSPAIFELRDHTTLAEAITYAGGLTNTVMGQRAVVERIDDHRVRRADDFQLDAQGLARELHDGDVVHFLRISSKFDNAITLRGNVAIPGLYPWHAGMRVHDLIPERGFLVTDDYWKRQNQLAVNARAGDFRITGTQLKNDVKRLSSEINWEYAVIQRMSPEDLTPHMLPFNLGKAIEGDAKENLELKPNDVITIFSQTDIQVPIAERTKFIHLEGEFNSPGVYEIQPGETLRHLVQRVGGVTAHAYLYGSEFTRESTRIDQQQRLDQYVNNLDQSLQVNTAVAASFIDPLAAAESRVQAETDRQTVERMKGVRASGRVVLELRPNATGTDALPDLVLEDGDRLLIPFRPATVNVIGSVYNSNAFIYKPGKTVGDYLRLAGGPTRGGDKGREFVIRADGSTVSKQQRSRLLNSSFDSTRLMPGDSIVVPVKLERGATLRLLRDYATIFGQFGLAAGGIRAIFP